MKIKLATSCFIVGTLLAPVAAFAADTAERHEDRSHPMTFVKDSVITTKIKAKLADEKMSTLTHIQVDTDSKGEVVLSGKVKTQEEADKAASIARATEGVMSVQNNIRIEKAHAAAKSESDRKHPMTYVKDSVITTKIKAKLAADHPGSLKHIEVDTDKDGVVWLSGTANTQAEIDQVVATAHNTDGVKSVKNDIKIKMDK